MWHLSYETHDIWHSTQSKKFDTLYTTLRKDLDKNMNSYEITFYTRSDGRMTITVSADTSAEAIEIARQHEDFCQLADYRLA